MNIGIDHGYYAIKTKHFCFPAGITAYSHEPYTLQNAVEYDGRFYVCGTGRQPILRDKTENDNYFLLTLAAIAKEIKHRGEKPECSVTIGAGLPLTTYGREKKPFRRYLLRSPQPVCFKFEGESYRVTIQDVLLLPQGYSAIVNHPEFVRDEPSVLVMDIGGWTVDLMRLDNGGTNASTCRSLELGMIRCIDEVREQVRRGVGGNAQRARAGPPVSHFCPAGQPCKRRGIRTNPGPNVGRCEQEVNRPRFSFRPSPQLDSHMRAWEYLQEVPEGQRNDFLVQAILRMREDTVLEEALRKLLREELQGILLQSGDALALPKANTASDSPAEAPIPQEMLGFLTDLMRND